MLATRTPGADGTKCETPLQHQVTKGSETGELVQPNALRSSARHQCCAEEVSWGFREDYTISKDKPIKPHPTRSHPFPDAATDFCQGGVEKQKN